MSELAPATNAGDQGDGARASYRVPIERGKVLEISRAMKSQNPAYFEGERPIAPVPFYYGAAYLWGYTWEQPDGSPLAEAGLDPERLLHAEEEVSFLGEPPRAGAVLSASLRVESVYEKQNRRGETLRFAIAVTKFRDAQGRVVAEARNTVVETPRPSEAEG